MGLSSSERVGESICWDKVFLQSIGYQRKSLSLELGLGWYFLGLEVLFYKQEVVKYLVVKDE